jgi:hypothetical protein
MGMYPAELGFLFLPPDVLGLVIGGWGGCLAAFYWVGVSRLRCSESWDCPSEDGVLVCSSLFGGTSFGAGGLGWRLPVRGLCPPPISCVEAAWSPPVAWALEGDRAMVPASACGWGMGCRWGSVSLVGYRGAFGVCVGPPCGVSVPDVGLCGCVDGSFL